MTLNCLVNIKTTAFFKCSNIQNLLVRGADHCKKSYAINQTGLMMFAMLHRKETDIVAACYYVLKIGLYGRDKENKSLQIGLN